MKNKITLRCIIVVPDFLGEENIKKKSYLEDITTHKSIISAPLIS